MSGSYRMVVDDTGEFTNLDLVENLGDAYETIEECVDMIQQLTGGDRQKIHQAWLEGHFKKRCPPENIPLATFDLFWGEE